MAIALSLPEEDKTKIREKVFGQIKLDDLKKDDGLDTLIAFLDSHLKKDDLADSLEKFEEFEDFERKVGMSITKYIATFDSLYRKIENLKMKLPMEILAFKLLRKANIGIEEKQLVLTGMNYEHKETLYEEAKKSLKKFKGDITEGQRGSSSAIKLEPAYIKENEEALLAAGYARARPCNYGNHKDRAAWNSREDRNDQHAFETNAHTCRNAESRKINPKGPDGQPLTCHCCGSFRHFVIDCPHSWENREKGCNEEDEHAVLFVRNRQTDDTQWRAYVNTNDCKYAILDSACSSTVCGNKWLTTYMNSLDSIERGKLCKVKSCKVFTFGNNLKFKSEGEYRIPATIAGRRVIIKTDVVAFEVPLLLSRSAMKRAQMKLNFEDDKVNIFGQDVDLETTASGHCCIKLERENRNQSGNTWSKGNSVTFCNKLKEIYDSGRIDRQKKSLYSELYAEC